MNHLLDRPRLLGLLCGAAAVGLGICYMAAAGAPSLYLLINLAALILGGSIWLSLRPAAAGPSKSDGRIVLALALALLATAIVGDPVEGASRWVNVGPLSVQVSLILLPALILLYARAADAIGTIGVAIAELALAAQPDRAMAGVLAAGIGAILLARPGRLCALALAAAIFAFAAAMLRPDALPAVPFVDRILYTSFAVHALAGLAVVAGAAMLVAPGLIGATRSAEQRPMLLAFAACWAAIVAAAALGNYPTPLVGYGGSAILGYLLSVGLLPRETRRAARAESAGAVPAESGKSDAATRELRAVKPA